MPSAYEMPGSGADADGQSGSGESFTTARLEAFSDGVIAVIITIMVLELKVPRENGWGRLRLPGFTGLIIIICCTGPKRRTGGFCIPT